LPKNLLVAFKTVKSKGNEPFARVARKYLFLGRGVWRLARTGMRGSSSLSRIPLLEFPFRDSTPVGLCPLYLGTITVSISDSVLAKTSEKAVPNRNEERVAPRITNFLNKRNAESTGCLRFSFVVVSGRNRENSVPLRVPHLHQTQVQIGSKTCLVIDSMKQNRICRTQESTLLPCETLGPTSESSASRC
jgi:hypothetical protein